MSVRCSTEYRPRTLTSSASIPPELTCLLELLIQYIITDGVIVWRAWVLCSDHSKIVLMIPVVMLAINTGALSSLFLTLFELGMTCPSIEYILVVYLITIAGRVIQFIFLDLQMFSIITHITSITQVVHLALSLLINIFATSIIALKAWYVRVHGVFGKYFVDCVLVYDMTCTYIIGNTTSC
jgi:hypothetical protein